MEGAAGAASMAGPAAINAVVAGMQCNVGDTVQNRNFPRLLHPTQWKLLDSQAAGMVVGNFLITFAFGLIMTLAVRIIGSTRIISSMDTFGLCRFPSAPFFVFQFFLQGTTLGAMVLVFYAPSPLLFIIGISALLVCVVVPFIMLKTIAESVPIKGYYLQDVRTQDRMWLRLLIGPGEWVSRHQNDHFALRYASLVRPYSQRWAGLSTVECAGSFCISAMEASNAQSLIGCGHKKAFIAFVFFLLFLIEIMVQARARVRDTYLLICVFLTQSAAMALMAVGYYHEDLDHSAFGTSATLLLVSVGMLLLKTACDLLGEVYVFCTGRRRRLQTIAFHSHDKDNADFADLALEQTLTSSELHAQHEDLPTDLGSITVPNHSPHSPHLGESLVGSQAYSLHSRSQSIRNKSLLHSKRSSYAIPKRGKRIESDGSITGEEVALIEDSGGSSLATPVRPLPPTRSGAPVDPLSDFGDSFAQSTKRSKNEDPLARTGGALITL